MVVISKEARSERGISHMRFTRNLISALRMQSGNGFDINPENWEAGIEAAILCGQQNGMKFNFVLMHETHLHHYAHYLGIMHPFSTASGSEYRTIFRTKEAARDYFEHLVHLKYRPIYEKMAEEFLEAFKDPEGFYERE